MRSPRPRRRSSTSASLFAASTSPYITGPTRLETDSKAAFDLSYNPEHHGRTKHVARRHFFVRDQVEEGEISVRLVKTDDNAADFFSKPLKPSSFFSLRDSIMNIQRE